MTALFVIGIVLAGILGWVACALTAIRVMDLAADGGLNSWDREEINFIATLFGPAWLVGVLVYHGGKKAGVQDWVHRYTHPQDARKKKRKALREQLLAESEKYRELARIAWNEGRLDEHEIFKAVADDYEEKAGGRYGYL